ncbi:saccharopine dehydrogenase NADP-binding domain-containing protein [Streptomyces sp. NPDC050400]|uniref:lactate/malate family dehydrogenase n=1 Tax=Streptomyces sp. NPDC050400 TaxID=3365610 RepID=UPI0037AA3A4A
MTTAPVHAIGIIGAGAVGQTVATALCTTGLTERLLIASRTKEQAQALVADIDDLREATGSRLVPHTATVTDMHACQAIVIAVRAAFTNTARTDVRLAGASANAPVIMRLAHQLRGYTDTVVLVTNPIDLMTRLFAETSGCPRAYGIGSNLDSARYRSILARRLSVPPAAVSGHVIGEHGDGAVICAHATTVHGRSVPLPLQQTREELHARAPQISAEIGRTRSGPAGAALSALRKALALDDGLEELSAPYDGVHLGLPLHFEAGQPTVQLPTLNATERRQLTAAHDKLRTAYQDLTTHLGISVPGSTAPGRTP